MTVTVRSTKEILELIKAFRAGRKIYIVASFDMGTGGGGIASTVMSFPIPFNTLYNELRNTTGMFRKLDSKPEYTANVAIDSNCIIIG